MVEGVGGCAVALISSLRTSKRSSLKTTARIRSPISRWLSGLDRLHAYQREAPTGDLTSVIGVDNHVVFPAGGLGSADVVRAEHDGVDVAPSGDGFAVGGDARVGDAVQGMAQRLPRWPPPP